MTQVKKERIVGMLLWIPAIVAFVIVLASCSPKIRYSKEAKKYNNNNKATFRP